MIALRLARLVVIVVIAMAAVSLPLSVYAAQIPVDGATCTLPDAIEAANTNRVTGGCTAGSGTDTLLLTAAT